MISPCEYDDTEAFFFVGTGISSIASDAMRFLPSCLNLSNASAARILQLVVVPNNVI